MTIRPARPAEAAAVDRLVQAAYARYVPRIGLRPAPMDADHAAEIARGELSVLEQDGQISGALVLVEDGDRLWIENVAVAPAAQGRGAGSALIEFAAAEAARLRLPELWLYTHELMTENIAFYERRGFVLMERREERGFHRVFMRRLIAPVHFRSP